MSESSTAIPQGEEPSMDCFAKELEAILLANSSDPSLHLGIVNIVWADHPPRRLASRSDSFLTVPVRISIAYLKDEESILSLKPYLTFRDPESIKYMESILPLGPSLIVEDPSGVVKYLLSMESTDEGTVDSQTASPQSVGAENAFKKIWAEMMIADS